MNRLITNGELIRAAAEELIDSAIYEDGYFDTVVASDDYSIILSDMIARINDLLSSSSGDIILLGYESNQDLLGFDEPENYGDVIEQTITIACSKQIDLLNSYYVCEIEQITIVSPHFDILIEFKGW